VRNPRKETLTKSVAWYLSGCTPELSIGTEINFWKPIPLLTHRVNIPGLNPRTLCSTCAVVGNSEGAGSLGVSPIGTEVARSLSDFWSPRP